MTRRRLHLIRQQLRWWRLMLSNPQPKRTSL